MDESSLLLRQIPHSIEAEQSVLGAMLIDARCIPDVVEALTGEDFYLKANREIYETIYTMFNFSATIDPVTVLDQMKLTGVYDENTSRSYLLQLMEITPTAANVKEYIRIVKDKALLRRIAETAGELTTLVQEGGETAQAVLDLAEQRVYAIRQGRSAQGLEPLSKILVDVFDQLQELSMSGSEVPGMATGFGDLDRTLTGFHGSELILLAARPGMGKTSFALNVLLHAGKFSGKSVVFFSLEMSREQLATRLISSEAFLDNKKLMTGKLSPDDWDKVTLASTALAHTKIYIDDNPSLSVADMNAKCRRIEDLGMVVIDYLQLMQSSGSTTRYAGENRQQVVADISRALEIMATSPFSACPSSPVPTRAARISAPCSRTSGSPAPLSRTPTWSCSSTETTTITRTVTSATRPSASSPRTAGGRPPPSPSSGCRNSLPSPLWSVIMKNPIDLAAQAAAFADKYNMLPQGSTVLCALSGGADSMALLSVLEALAKPRSLTLHAAHFNHQLRGEESQRDEDFVVQWCQKRGIPLVVGRGDVAQEAQEQGKGVEETARAMRYGFLTATAQELGADKIATAHNADDNAETLLLHLARGTGLDGLTGIPPVRGILIRPLLATPRIDIAVYLAQEEIPHVEDSSNQDTVYARNRLRQEVMPVLRDLNPAFVSTLAANLVHLREDRDLLHAMAEKATKTAVVSEGRVSLSARTLAALPHPVAVRAVKQLLAKVDRFQISSVHLEQILSLAAGPSPSATLNLPDDLFVWREYDQLVLCPSSAMPLAFSLRLLTGPGTFALDNGWKIEITETICPDLPAQEEYEWDIAQNTVTFPLVLRSRQAGDQLRLPGRRTKTLKKWYIDEKIPRQNRQSLPVLADESGLLAAAGLGPNYPRLAQPGQPALHIRLTPKTKPEERT